MACSSLMILRPIGRLRKADFKKFLGNNSIMIYLTPGSLFTPFPTRSKNHKNDTHKSVQ